MLNQFEKMGQRLQVELERQMFDSFVPIDILGFLSAIQMARNTNRSDESAALWLSRFHQNITGAALNARIRLSSLGCLNENGEIEVLLQSIRLFVGHVSNRQYYNQFRYGPQYSQAACRHRAGEYVQSLKTKALHGGSASDEKYLKRIFIRAKTVNLKKRLEGFRLKSSWNRYSSSLVTYCHSPVYYQAMKCWDQDRQDKN